MKNILFHSVFTSLEYVVMYFHEINMFKLNEKYKATFHLFTCLCGVFMLSQQCLVGPDLFGAMHLK